MPDPDPTPKLRILDEGDAAAEQPVVRLGKSGETLSAASKPMAGPAPETAERIEAEGRENFDGRSIDPTIDAILDPQEAAENIEQPWGREGTRLAGIPYGWFILIALVVAGAGVWSLRSMKKGEESVVRVQETVREKVEEDEKNEAAALELVGAVEAAARNYLAADTLEEILPLIREPERVRPLIEETWAANPPRSRRFKRLAMFQPAVIEGRSFWVIQAEIEDAPSESLLLEELANHEVKVDWETQACYQPLPWDSFATTRPVGKSLEFRVWATPDNHYSHEFSSFGKWNCFRLTAKNSDEHVFGYAPLESEVAKKLIALCRGSRHGTATVILSLKVPDQSNSPRGVLIEKLVEPRWARVPPAAKNAP
jgi:hypothetical protein